MDMNDELLVMSPDVATWDSLSKVDCKNPLLIMGDEATVQQTRVVQAIM